MSTINDPTNKSNASEDFLRPETNLGEAILHLVVQPSGQHFIIEIYDEFTETLPDGTTRTNYRAPASISAARFVERRFKHGFQVASKQGVFYPRYFVPITDYTIHLINNAWTGKKIISDAAKPFFKKIFLREFCAESNAKRAAEFRHNGAIPTSEWHDAHDAKLIAAGITLNPYQKVASYNCTKSAGYALFCAPGTGKTCMMIRKLDYVIDHASHSTMTVIFCPKNVRRNWINEIDKFSTNNSRIFVYQLEGKNANDRACNFISAMASDEAFLPDGTQKHLVVITGFETWVETPQLWKEDGLGFEYDLGMLDESQNIANPGTKRTKSFLEMRSVFANKVIATGTPFRNTPFDIYSQLEFLGEGYSGFESFTAFRNFFGNYQSSFNGMTQLVGFSNIPLLQEKIAKHAFVIKKEEALPYLPKKSFSIKECAMTKEQEKVYCALQESLIAVMDSYGPEPDAMTVNNILTQMLRLAQITSGFAAMDSGLINRFDPNPKLDLLIASLLGDSDSEEDGVLANPLNKAIVWCSFVENIKTIRARLKLEGIECVTFHGSLHDDDKADAVQKFNCDPATRVLVGIQASGGVGLNLVGFDPYNPDRYQTNCTDAFVFSSNWSWVNREQALDRFHRHNTRVPVHVTDLIVPGTIDEDIFARLKMKGDMSVGLQDIRAILSKRISTFV